MGAANTPGDEKNESPVILSNLNNLHQCQLELCDALETLADQLPDQIDNQECLYLARMIYPTVK